jgi:Tol biopolymer transport system component
MMVMSEEQVPALRRRSENRVRSASNWRRNGLIGGLSLGFLAVGFFSAASATGRLLTAQAQQVESPSCPEPPAASPSSTPTSGDLGLWVMDADGSNQQQVVGSLPNAQSVAWSPDGTEFAFVERYGPLVIVDVDGTGRRTLTAPRVFEPSTRSWSGEIVTDPVWSPDGTKIAFAADSEFEGLDLYVMNSDGSGRRLLATEGREPTWSPDGMKIAFASLLGNGDARLEVVNANGSARRTVTSKKGMWYLNPSWSPDGEWIAFASAPHEDWGSISMVRPDGSDRRCLTAGQGKPIPTDPAWSPAGTTIAFADGQGVNVINADGSNWTLISDGGFAPSWSPDGSKIAYFR